MHLEVPLVSQEDDYSCVPACLKMVLEYFSKNPELKVPNLTLEQIKRIVKTDSTGTSLEDIKRINQKLMRGSHLIEFRPKEDCSFNEIEKELQAGIPVIVWIKRITDDLKLSHSVVINGLSEDKLTIHYQDPIFGSQEQDTASFMNEWGNSYNILIKVSVRKKPRQMVFDELPKLGESDIDQP